MGHSNLLQQYSDLYKKHGGSAFNEVNIEINRLYYEEQKAMTRVKTKDGIKLRFSTYAQVWIKNTLNNYCLKNSSGIKF